MTLSALALAGCASGPNARDGGVATLDALRELQAVCAAKGQAMQLKDGGDAEWLGDYGCVRK